MKIKNELWRLDPLSFAIHLSADGRTGQPIRHAKHLEIISEAIARARLGFGSNRIVVSMPPRHGKSELSSKWFPLWALDNDPKTRIILTSYEASFAASWSAQCRQLANEYQDHLSFKLPAQGRTDQWKTGHGQGGMMTAGVGGAITGKGADIFIIDDPIKNSEEANSATIRQKQWDWFFSTAKTRLEPGGIMVIIMTRWHSDDLVGKIKAQYDAGGWDPIEDNWQFIELPALALENDPIGREEGAALWPSQHSQNKIEAEKKSMLPWVFEALYQQKPTSDQGDTFKREWFKYFSPDVKQPFFDLGGLGEAKRVAKEDCVIFQTVDLATSTRENADFFVCSTFAVTPDSDLLILDVLQDHISGANQREVMHQQYKKWQPSIIGIESVAYQQSFVQILQDDGLPVIPLKADRDKQSRAIMAATRYFSGHVYHNRFAHWLPDLESELLQFPKGKHDDMVDTVAYAALGIAQKLFVKKKRVTMDFSDDTLDKQNFSEPPRQGGAFLAPWEM